MFIYKYMSGKVNTIEGGEDDDGYDPHQHRKIESPTTYLDTMIHMLKGSIGAGILCMPDAVCRLGIPASLAAIAIIGIVATYCIQLLIAAQYKLCKKWKRGYMAYPKSMKLAVQDGPACMRWSASFFYYFVDIVLVVWQLGICCIYFIFVAENIKQICDFYGVVYSLRMHIIFQLIPQILLNLVKSLKLMSPLSMIANMLISVGLILVFFYLIEDDVTITNDMFNVKRMADIPIFIGITLFALEAVGVILALEYNMENPKQFVGLFGLFNVGMFFIITLYAVVGVFGYITYDRNIMASITLNLPQDHKKAQVSRIVIAIAILFSFPLQNFVAYNIMWRKAQKKIQDSQKVVVDYSMRVLMVLIPWLVALACPYLGPFIALFGAFCLSLLAIVFPGVMDLCLWHPNRYGICFYKLLRDVFLIVFGLFCLIAGCYTSMLEILDA